MLWIFTNVRSPGATIKQNRVGLGKATVPDYRQRASMRPSPPVVDRHCLAVSGAHDLPVAVGLAANNDHVDPTLGKMVDQLVVLGLEPGRHRLLAEGRPGID